MALALAARRSSFPWRLLAGGSDGPGLTAGALVDNDTLKRIRCGGFAPDRCLALADAGSCLQAAGDLLVTGPSGTNVMDIILGWRDI